MKKDASDLELLDLCLAGQDEAFEELVSRYADKVFRLAMRITKKTSDAEEVVQEVLISVYRKLHTFRRQSAFSSWLYRITFNTALMHLRNSKKFRVVGLDDIDGLDLSTAYKRSDTSDVEFMSIRHELRQILVRAIDTLDPMDRNIFILRDVDGLSNKEVSDATDLSLSAVKSRLHRGRQQLRVVLSRYVGHQASTAVSASRKSHSVETNNLSSNSLLQRAS